RNGWLLAVAGWDDGGHAAQMQQAAQQCGLGPGAVVFPGGIFAEEKEAALRNARAFILPSFSEGFPMSVLEAWSYGLPVLMTRECNIPEAFGPGAAIEISTDPAALARSLESALTEATLDPVAAAGSR